MQYGHFDDKRKEYVIDRPDTPKPWSNYLGSTEYGAIITNHAGGYSFFRSSALGRFTRLRFNAVPLDQPGRYFYLRDRDSGDYWTTSWQPVGKPLSKYKSTCRHGTAYTRIDSRYGGIASETTYFVPLGERFEYWLLKLTNKTKKPRRLSVFTFVEYASEWNAKADMIDLQYSFCIVRANVVDKMVDHIICNDLPLEHVEVHAPDRMLEVRNVRGGADARLQVTVPPGLDGTIWFLRTDIGSATRYLSGPGKPQHVRIEADIDLHGVPGYIAPTWEQWFDPRNP